MLNSTFRMESHLRVFGLTYQLNIVFKRPYECVADTGFRPPVEREVNRPAPRVGRFVANGGVRHGDDWVDNGSRLEAPEEARTDGCCPSRRFSTFLLAAYVDS